jgi:DNA replication licensing factor MCM6
MKILNLMVRRVRDDEANSGEGVEQEDLLIWYLEQIESEIDTEDDLQNERDLAVKVLKRMIKVCAIISLSIIFDPLTNQLLPAG